MALQGPFKTPQNERSFSALVDQVVLETGKTAALRSVVQYANLSIRECQGLVLSARDLVEDTAEADAEPFLWTRPVRFRSMRAVLFVTQQYYAKLKLPGRQLLEHDYYYYASDDSFVFKGCIIGEDVDVAYYTWSKPLIYYGRLNTDTSAYPFAPYDTRPAYYDIVTDEWMYLNADEDDYADAISPADTAEEATRRTAAMHWILEDWYDMIVEGTKAKTFKQFNDDRFGATFATYKHMQEEFRRNSFEAEAHENVD